MQYEAPPRRSSIGTVIVVMLLLGFMFLVGLAVIGVAVLVFARAETHRAQAIRQRDVAMRRVEEARARVEHLRTQAEQTGQTVEAEARDVFTKATETVKETPPAEMKDSLRVADREITIQLDEGGKIQVDGTAYELPQLKEMLEKAGQGRENAIIVLVKADKRCLFGPVAGVLAVCKELDLPHVRIAALDD